MLKLPALMLSGLLTLGVGGGAVLGNGVVVSKLMDNSIATATQATMVDKDVLTVNQGVGVEIRKGELIGDGIPIAQTIQLKNQGDGSAVVFGYAQTKDFIGAQTIDISKPQFVEGEPGQGYITKEKALEIAIEEYIKGGQLTREEALDRYTIEAKFNVANPDAPQWWVDFALKNADDSVTISQSKVCLDAKTGEVLFVVATGRVNALQASFEVPLLKADK